MKLRFIGFLAICLSFMSLVSNDEAGLKLDWSYFRTTVDVDNAIKSETPVLFFKHSHKCGLSTLILEDFEREWKVSKEKCKIVMINVWDQRDLSNYISSRLDITHHSPQVIVVQNNKVLYQNTHGKIKAKEIRRAL
jgi:bacillithiol system protein YtxJ